MPPPGYKERNATEYLKCYTWVEIKIALIEVKYSLFLPFEFHSKLRFILVFFRTHSVGSKFPKSFIQIKLLLKFNLSDLKITGQGRIQTFL